MKIQIGICDDNEIYLTDLKDIVAQIFEEKDVEYGIQTFLSGEELLEKADILDLVFLDIEMPVLDGIEVGRRIQLINSKCKIIMATGKERYTEAFKINALRYLNKPYDVIDTKEAIEEYLRRTIGYRKIEVFKDRKRFLVNETDIQYITNYDSSAVIYAKGHCFRSACSLKDFEAKLDNRLFFRINKTYIVNFVYVQIIRDEKIMVKDKEMMIARKKVKEFKKAYMDFDLEYR